MDTQSSNNATQSICLRIMRPIIRLLLRNGIAYGEFSELCKALYVETATREFGIRGRPTNISRTAILTGLSRKEVRRLREQAEERAAAPDTRSHANAATRVLSGWYQDPAFHDEHGKPRALTTEGEAGFADLVRRHAGDVPVTALLKELQKAGAVSEDGDGRVVPLTRYYMPAKLDGEAVEHAGEALNCLAETVSHNLFREKQPSRFEGIVFNDRIPRAIVAEFHAFAEAKGQELLETLDEWLTSHEARETQPGDQPLANTGLGLYFFEKPNDTGEA